MGQSNLHAVTKSVVGLRSGKVSEFRIVSPCKHGNTAEKALT